MSDTTYSCIPWRAICAMAMCIKSVKAQISAGDLAVSHGRVEGCYFWCYQDIPENYIKISSRVNTRVQRRFKKHLHHRCICEKGATRSLCNYTPASLLSALFRNVLPCASTFGPSGSGSPFPVANIVNARARGSVPII